MVQILCFVFLCSVYLPVGETETGHNITEVSTILKSSPSCVVRPDRSNFPHSSRPSSVCAALSVVHSLPTEVAKVVGDLIYEIPVWNSCDILKDAINKLTALSGQQSFDTFFASLQIHEVTFGTSQNRWLTVATFVNAELPSLIGELLTSFKEDTLTVELTEATCRMFDANFKNQSAVSVLFTSSVDSISQFNEQIDH